MKAIKELEVYKKLTNELYQILIKLLKLSDKLTVYRSDIIKTIKKLSELLELEIELNRIMMKDFQKIILKSFKLDTSIALEAIVGGPVEPGSVFQITPCDDKYSFVETEKRVHVVDRELLTKYQKEGLIKPLKVKNE